MTGLLIATEKLYEAFKTDQHRYTFKDKKAHDNIACLGMFFEFYTCCFFVWLDVFHGAGDA